MWYGTPKTRLAAVLLSLTVSPPAIAPAFAAPPDSASRPAESAGGKSAYRPAYLRSTDAERKTNSEDQPADEEMPREKTNLERLRERPATGIDLPSALWLGGVRNLNILLARQRVVTDVARRQFAAAQILPTIRGGMNYDKHTGALMQSSGNVLNIKRSSLFVGAGSGAVAAGTVGIPGVGWNMNLAEGLFGYLKSRQAVEQQQFTSRAQENEMLRKVAAAYLELLRAEGQRVLALKNREEIERIVGLTRAYAKAGAGRQADLERAETNLEQRNTDVTQTEYQSVAASAHLVQLLNLDPNVRLVPADESVVPTPIVPDPIPVRELLAIAAFNRPELGAQQAALQQAMLELRKQQLLPFSPNVIIMFSSGSFGGGSDIVAGKNIPAVARNDILTRGLAFGAPVNQPEFGKFGTRVDFDGIAYWTLKNMGCGNLAQIRVARSQLREADLEKLQTLNQVRREVATAYVRTHTMFAMIESNEQAVLVSQKALEEDELRIRGFQGLPLEVIRSQQLLAQARQAYLNAIIEYNQAQLDLFVALGQPPADALARPIPEGFVPPAEGNRDGTPAPAAPGPGPGGNQ